MVPAARLIPRSRRFCVPIRAGFYCGLIEFSAKFNLKVANVTVKDVVDSSLVAELDKSGFIDRVYKEMSSRK
jgi:hypothetical protein